MFIHNLFLVTPDVVEQILHDRHSLVPNQSVIWFRKQWATKLPEPLPLIVLRRDDVVAEEPEKSVLADRLWKPLTRPCYLLRVHGTCKDSIRASRGNLILP